jgi:hypothetical protein
MAWGRQIRKRLPRGSREEKGSGVERYVAHLGAAITAPIYIYSVSIKAYSVPQHIARKADRRIRPVTDASIGI